MNEHRLYEHFKNIQRLYGDDVYVQIPNDIFKTLSKNIKSKNGKTNVQQSSFAYAYVLISAIMYKYAYFVDVDNSTYIQNSDIKEILGYSKTTKTVDHIIKKGGVLDSIGLTKTVKDYPIMFDYEDEKINGIEIRTFTTISELEKSDITQYKNVKSVVKNRNYEIKEPTFLFTYNGENGTLYDYSNTHKVSLFELLNFMSNDNLDNVDMYVYFFIKSKCKGYKNNSNSLRLNMIVSDLGISKDTFYERLNKIKDMKYVDVWHRGWVSDSDSKLESNLYKFKGIRK